MTLLTRFSIATFALLVHLGPAWSAETRTGTPPARATGTEERPVSGLPDGDTGTIGQLRIGQTYGEVLSLLLARNPPARLMVMKRRFELRDMHTDPNVALLQAVLYAPDRSTVETLRLRFTSKMTGQLLYFIHRDVAFTRASARRLDEFGRTIAARFQGSTWSLLSPDSQSYRQIYTDGRMLSWQESLRHPELGGCFVLTGGASFEQVLEDGSLAPDREADTAQCGGGVDADWRGDVRRFTVTMIDFPLLQDDRHTLRDHLASAARRAANPPARSAP